MQVQQLRFVMGGWQSHDLGIEIHAHTGHIEFHRAIEQAFVFQLIRMAGVAKMHLHRLKRIIGNEPEKLDHAHHHAFIEMTETVTPDHLLEENPIAFLKQFPLGGIGQQALIIQRPLQAFTKGRTGQEQVLQHLAFIDGNMFTQMQPDMFIARHFFQSLPEPFLGIMRGTQVRDLQNGLVEPNLRQHGIGINTGFYHGLVGHP